MEEKEPSVLDFLKSRLNPWQSEKVEVPETVSGEPAPQQPGRSFQMPRSLPWRTVLALLLAFIGQSILDPTGFNFGLDTGSSLRETQPEQALAIGLVFYAIAAAFLFWAYFVKEFSLPALPVDETVTEPQSVRSAWLVGSVIIGLIAFLSLTNNLFTPLNATCWLVALTLYLRAVWLHGSQRSVVVNNGVEGEPIVPAPTPFTVGGFVTRWWDVILLLFIAFLGASGLGANLITSLGISGLDINIFTFGLLPFVIALLIIWLRDPQAILTPGQRIRAIFARPSWQINLTRWTLLILAVSVVAIFFRFYRLDGVIAEPFSDQAEKLLDVSDLISGQTHIFFERNTGREFDQFYWTAMLVYVLNTGISFITLKTGTVLIGLLTLPYMYLLGKELGGRRVALFALVLAGVAYWPNTISRIGLRFPLYAAFAAPTLYYLIKGLRTHKRNDFILCGLFLGFGLNGYSPFRFVPFVVLAGLGLYLLHKPSQGRRKQTIMLSIMLVATSVFVFLPLGRYAMEHPEMFSERALTRLTDAEHPLPAQEWCPLPGNGGTAVCIFGSNTFKAMLMFFWDNGSIWVHSIPGRPALDIVAAVLFGIGYIFLLVRYILQRRWQDIFLLISVPLLLMPSILSLAFPDENPSLNRTSATFVPVFVIAAIALDGVYTALKGEQGRGLRRTLAIGTVVLFLGLSSMQNYDLEFNKFDRQFRAGAWNTSDMGRIIKAFMAAGNSSDNAWVVPFPYWVDTRLVGIQAGLPTRDFALDRETLEARVQETVDRPGAKLFIVKDEDLQTLDLLRRYYPTGVTGKFDSPLEGKDFWIFSVPDSQPVPAP